MIFDSYTPFAANQRSPFKAHPVAQAPCNHLSGSTKPMLFTPECLAADKKVYSKSISIISMVMQAVIAFIAAMATMWQVRQPHYIVRQFLK